MKVDTLKIDGSKTDLKQQQEDLFDFWLKRKACANKSESEIQTLGKECYSKGFTDALLYMMNMHFYGISKK